MRPAAETHNMSMIVSLTPILKKKRLRLEELTPELEREIVALVGKRGRNAFVREAVRQELERRRVLESRNNAARPKAARGDAGLGEVRRGAARRAKAAK